MDEPPAEVVSYSRRIRDLATVDPDGVGLVSVAADGSERVLTWAELDRRSTAVARAFAGRGVEVGDRVGLQLRNSPALVLGILAAWRLGATPVAMRWDLPDWERARLVEVLAGRVVVDDEARGLLDAAEGGSGGPLPDALAPMHGASARAARRARPR
ncbi:MAG: class I adenylate-forming enzyme family protein [Acidimicrobiales bacterium]